MALKPSIQALLDQAKRNHAARLEAALAAGSTPTSAVGSAVLQQVKELHVKSAQPTKHSILGASGFTPSTGVSLNEKQSTAVELAIRGKSINLIGAAGTGKTTTTREVIAQLVRLPHISQLSAGTKHLVKDAPGIVVISFTNKAVNNLKKFLPQELQLHCMTYHKVLQYGPVRYQNEPGNPAGGSTMRFEPHYTEDNKLPHISCVIVEESSMVSEELHRTFLKALPNPDATQFIFLGDLNQLPPIFGPSILGFKLLELQTVELTHVYRQALESPIITLAHKIREGRGFSANGKGILEEGGFTDDRAEHGKVTIRPWKKKTEARPAMKVCLHNFLVPLVTADDYDFNETAILCPFNKSFGTLELNKFLAQSLGEKRKAEVFEVLARGTASYWAVGDRVLVDRREAIILRIEPTVGYAGKFPQESSVSLDRWGKYRDGKEHHASPSDEDRDVKLLLGLEALESMDLGDGEEQKNAASHTITVEFVDSGATQSLSSSGDINSMLFSYVLTVHKSQGSEWKRVILLLHYSHNSMLSRELLYTAITRAKHELFIICEPDRKGIYNSLTKAAKSPEIHGVTLEEKAHYFKAKKRSMQRMEDKEAAAEHPAKKMADFQGM
jgi:exodeoxyribonuclease V alpha subunit